MERRIASVVKVIFVGLSYLTFPIGFVVSYVMLAITYFLVITPIGLLMRLFGRDAMQLRLDRGAASYWPDRGALRPSTDYFHQS